MKKILLPILALGGLLFASSCQMDEPDAGKLTGEVDFSITAGIPGGITTYSPTDGEAFSHLGGINNVTGDYVLRFILEVYDGDAVAYKETKYLEVENFSSPEVTFNPRLLAKEYDFVFWADFVAKGDSEENRGDLYYNTSNGLTTISYEDNVTATVFTTDLVDAYYAKEEVNLTQSSQSLQVTLQRPFGKIRLLATDNPQNIGDPNSNIPTSAIIAFTDAKVPTTFNARKGEASEPALSVTGYTFYAVNEKPVVNGQQYSTSAYLLGQTYFFESPSSTAYDMTVTVRNGDTQIGYRELTNIPVSANKLTTVIGNFYTNEGNIDVIVEDEFSEDEEQTFNAPITVTSQADLIEILNSIPENNDVEQIIIIPEDLVIGGEAFSLIINKSNVTIKGANAGDSQTGSAGQTFATSTAENISGYIEGTIQIAADNVTLDGLNFSGKTTIINYQYEPINNFTLKNCYAENINGVSGFLYLNGNDSRSNGITITNNTVMNVSNDNSNASAFLIWKCNNVIFSKNSINETQYHGVQFNSNENILVENNTISNVERSGIQAADYAEGSIIFRNNTIENSSLVDGYAAIRIYSLLNGMKNAKVEVVNNAILNIYEITQRKCYQPISIYNAQPVDGYYVDATPSSWICDENTVEGEFIEGIMIGFGKISNTTQKKRYETISEAITEAANDDNIYLSSNTFNEVVTINSDKTLTFIGQEGTKVKSAYLNSGNTTFENITFYGAGPSAGSYSTVFAGGSATMNLKNCEINVEEQPGEYGRPVETAYNANVNITLENCTITANSAKNAYLNPVGANGSLTVTGCTFVDKGLTAEFNCDANSARVYPEITQNNFGSNTLGFSYYAEPKITDASGLDDKTKKFCINVLEQNTFTGENKIKVTPLEYVQGNFFWINDPADLISEANNDMGVSLALEKALRKALTEQGFNISASQKLSYTDLHNLTGELNLSNSGISQLGINDNGFYNNPLSGNGGGQSKFADGLKNVTKIDLSGNTFTYVPACTFYGPDGDGNFTDPAPDHKLQEIVLPESCTALYQWAIHKLPSLRTVNVENITSMGDYAMACNRNLELNINTDLNESLALAKKTFRFSPKVTGSLDEYAEETNIWFGVEWGSSDRKEVTSDLYSFEETGVTGTVEGLVNSKWLYFSAFTNACAVTGDVLNIPAEIEGKPLVDFADWLFQKWLIKEAHIPSSVEYFGYGIFNNCPNLEKVSLFYVDSYNPGKVYTNRANSYLLGGSTDNITEITIYYNGAEPADKDDFLSKVFGSDLDAVKDKISWVMQ